MAARKLRIPRRWQSAIVSVVLGLVAALLALKAGDIEVESRWMGQQFLRPSASHGLRFDRVAIKQQAITERFFTRLDTAIYDSLFATRGPHDNSIHVDKQTFNIPEVVIVYVNDHVIKEFNDPNVLYLPHTPYPFRRSVNAEVLRRLKRAGATVIGVDETFSEPSAYNPSGQEPTDDREFAEALKECGNVVLTAKFVQETGGKLWEVQKGSSDFPINSPVPIRENARCASPADLPPDNQDRAIRRFELFAGYYDADLPVGRRDYLNFAPMIAALYWNDKQPGRKRFSSIPAAEFEQDMLKNIAMGRFLDSALPYHKADLQSFGETPDLPKSLLYSQNERWQALTPLEQQAAARLKERNRDQSLRICFAGYPGNSSCRLVSFDAIFDPHYAGKLKEWFDGKIVLIGSMVTGEKDAYNTPLCHDDEIRFGVEVHANIIHTLLSRHFYQDFDENRRITLVWLCSLLTALLVLFLKPLRATVPVLLLMAAVWLLTGKLFDAYVFLPPGQIFTAATLAFVSETVFFYSVENRRASAARSTFQRYVGPKVMQQVLDTDFKPGTVIQRYLTIMFTDVQGFTSLSEKMSPAEVVETFNRYLNQMVEIIDKHGGTLDKIMGDGVMAYFNAPLPLPHHEQKAVECALEMQAAMREWRKLSVDLGLPPLKVRIGINAGEVVFGEVGAKRQLGYTVIGDAVNAAARLEPLNKEFGTEILISEAVRDQIDPATKTEYVGKLEIRGRKEGIRAYSVSGGETETDSPYPAK